MISRHGLLVNDFAVAKWANDCPISMTCPCFFFSTINHSYLSYVHQLGEKWTTPPHLQVSIIQWGQPKSWMVYFDGTSQHKMDDEQGYPRFFRTPTFLNRLIMENLKITWMMNRGTRHFLGNSYEQILVVLVDIDTCEVRQGIPLVPCGLSMGCIMLHPTSWKVPKIQHAVA